MKNTFKTLLVLTSFFALLGCGGSKFSEGQDPVTTTRPSDPVQSFVEPTTDNRNVITQHCSDISTQQTQFYSFVKSVNNKDQYAQLLNSQGLCQFTNGRLREEDCNFWTRTMGVTLAFFQGFPQTATIAIDATGDGFPQNGGQGFPVRQAQIGGQIDCSQQDLTINAATANGWLQIVADRNFGNKITTDIRARIYFNSQLLGTAFLRRQ